MAALPFGLKCSRITVYAPLLNQIGGLEAYPNPERLDMSSRFAGPLNVIYYFGNSFYHQLFHVAGTPQTILHCHFPTIRLTGSVIVCKEIDDGWKAAKRGNREAIQPKGCETSI